MKKNDLLGISVSLGLHLLLLVAFGLLTAARPEPEPLGFIQVEFGPLSEGRPVQRSEQTTPDVTERTDQPDPQPEQEASPPKDSKPVDLPDQPQDLEDVDKVQSPETETISPQQQNNPAEVSKPDPKPETKPVRPLGSGDREGTTGAAEGRTGTGQSEERSAPYQIEGLNRITVTAPVPNYAEKVNATIRIRVTVDPQGRIVRRVPLLKGNPALEQAVMDALQRWRFNALPPNAPQEHQTGVITFRFRLE